MSWEDKIACVKSGEIENLERKYSRNIESRVKENLKHEVEETET
jgi:hypothetical protein